MKIKVTYVPITRLRPYANNARTHSDEQLRQIAASIKQFGFVNPILVGEDWDIIAGHGRHEAAVLLDLKEVPVIQLGHLSERERKALVLADNKIALNAGWDFAKLAEELNELVDLDFDVSLTGFDEQELDALLKASEAILPDGFIEPQRIHVSAHERKTNTDKSSANEQPSKAPIIFTRRIIVPCYSQSMFESVQQLLSDNNHEYELA